ncbi:uncharacterized protein LOC143446482 [Clavelina lepadiformis]|uniref:Uncharacterized protein n=1 Tax=Clavelina lepadiformis TaxID=159417 RepID=A0ABP0FGS7_CLALP
MLPTGITSPDTEKQSTDNFENVIETPLMLGVIIVVILLCCIAYHWIYKKFCFNERRLERFGRNERQLSAAVTAFLSQAAQTANQQDRVSSGSSSLPTYDDLPPSYHVVASNETSGKRETASQTEDVFCSPPPYELFKKNCQHVQTAV